MESARALLPGISTHVDGAAVQSEHSATKSVKDVRDARDESSLAKSPSISDLENRGASGVLKEDAGSQILQQYPYLYSHVGDLTVNDVEDLLNNYKQLIFKYLCLHKGLAATSSPSIPVSKLEAETEIYNEPTKEHKDGGAVDQTEKSQNDGGETDDDVDCGSPFEEQRFEFTLSEDAALVGQSGAKGESSPL